MKFSDQARYRTFFLLGVLPLVALLALGQLKMVEPFIVVLGLVWASAFAIAASYFLGKVSEREKKCPKL